MPAKAPTIRSCCTPTSCPSPRPLPATKAPLAVGHAKVKALQLPRCKPGILLQDPAAPLPAAKVPAQGPTTGSYCTPTSCSIPYPQPKGQRRIRLRGHAAFIPPAALLPHLVLLLTLLHQVPTLGSVPPFPPHGPTCSRTPTFPLLSSTWPKRSGLLLPRSWSSCWSTPYLDSTLGSSLPSPPPRTNTRACSTNTIPPVKYLYHMYSTSTTSTVPVPPVRPPG